MINTVIFDMDGLLIDSEPSWQKAGIQTLQEYGVSITLEQYHQTTGLRTSEWIDWWFTYFGLNKEKSPQAIKRIEDRAIELIREEGEPFPGTPYILNFFRQHDFTIGLATSSPLRLVEVVMEKLDIGAYFSAFSSAEYLKNGKPHPEVYMQCADMLKVKPQFCICFEDSFNGMISAKAAKMKCVVVPAADEYERPKWMAGDLKIPKLETFAEQHFQLLTGIEAEARTSLR